MSPIQTNTTQGLCVKQAAADLSASIGCFATIDTSAHGALPANHGLALFVIDNAYDSGGTHYVELNPLTPNRNVRVIASGPITAADNIETDAAGKAVKASSGHNILAIAEESGVAGQYVLMRPLGGIQTA